MSTAAQHNRGTAVLVRQIDAEVNERGRHNREVLARLNAVPKGQRAAKPFGPVAIEFPDRHGNWWLLSAGKDRHSHTGYCYKSVLEIMAAWKIVVVGVGKDAAGSFYICEVQ